MLDRDLLDLVDAGWAGRVVVTLVLAPAAGICTASPVTFSPARSPVNSTV
ncbi:hypothetical protein HK414_16145 [Ramlibacter terrae]|uniref:Uncharacterized protein n=1 Tax=Ramlibacter terrae TaxID=2732511 RepID=A0ABX6P6S1_9BURK|nr:hypothetical protein HK414_16145 [Ramlibacter terrae]